MVSWSRPPHSPPTLAPDMHRAAGRWTNQSPELGSGELQPRHAVQQPLPPRGLASPLHPSLPHGPRTLGAQMQRQRPLPMTHPEVVVQPPGLALPEPRARPCPCLGCARHMAGPPPEHAACRTALACAASPGPAQAPWRCSGPGSPAGRTCSPPRGGHRLSLRRGLAAPAGPILNFHALCSCVSRCVPGPCRAEGPPRPALTTCSHDRHASGQARVPPRPPPFCRVWTRPWAEPPGEPKAGALGVPGPRGWASLASVREEAPPLSVLLLKPLPPLSCTCVYMCAPGKMPLESQECRLHPGLDLTSGEAQT